MKTILLPTDFSDNAWNAIFTAVKLYAQFDCRFMVLHAYEPKPLNLLGRKGQQRLGTIYESLADHSKQELRKILDYLKKNHHNPKHDFVTLSRSDTLVDAIKKVLDDEDIDLICMGTQGATGAKELFMGSNTVKVLNQIEHCPMLIVPAEHDVKGLNILAVATDYSKKYSNEQLLPLTDLVSVWHPEINIVHVTLEAALSDRQKANQRFLTNSFEGSSVRFQDLDFETGVAHDLNKFIADNQVDILALIRYRHTIWEKIIGQPVVKKLGFHTEIPLMVLH